MLAHIIISGVSSFVGVMIAIQLATWRHTRADRQAAAGRPVAVPVAVRAAGKGLWRSGTVTFESGRVAWTPNLPWSRALTLQAVGYASQRKPYGWYRWQIAPASVIMSCSIGGKDFEIAVLPRGIKHLYQAEFATAA